MPVALPTYAVMLIVGLGIAAYAPDLGAGPFTGFTLEVWLGKNPFVEMFAITSAIAAVWALYHHNLVEVEEKSLAV